MIKQSENRLEKILQKDMLNDVLKLWLKPGYMFSFAKQDKTTLAYVVAGFGEITKLSTYLVGIYFAYQIAEKLL